MFSGKCMKEVASQSKCLEVFLVRDGSRVAFLGVESLDDVENIPPFVEMSRLGSGTVTHSKIEIGSPFSTNCITCILINYETRETFPLNDFVFVIENRLT